VLGRANLEKVIEYARKGHNVVLLANHQVRRALVHIPRNAILPRLVRGVARRSRTRIS
jgi:hypothetical protein